jgi:hypothetical protein
MSDEPAVGVDDSLALASCAAILSLLPLYGAFWWWDLWTHWLSGVAITALARRLRRAWWVSLLCLACLGVGWEWLEYTWRHPYLIRPTLPDTLSDLSAELVAWVSYRVWYERFHA